MSDSGHCAVGLSLQYGQAGSALCRTASSTTDIWQPGLVTCIAAPNPPHSWRRTEMPSMFLSAR